MDDRETLASWLRDAHAMERATIDNIERLLERMEDYPVFTERYRQHLEDSRKQLGRVERALEILGTGTSGMKDTAMRVLGVAQAFGTAAAPDEAVKQCLAAYSYENLEIASYISLAAAAETCGLPEIKTLCEQSLKEEREMADWLERFIGDVTQQYLRKERGESVESPKARASQDPQILL